MRQQDVSALMSAATKKLGGSPEFSMCLIGESAAYPHGSKQPQTVDAGRTVLMDCGCTVHGYQSAVSRTWVHGGHAGKEQRPVGGQVHPAQRIAFEAAKIGASAASVDDAVGTYSENRH